MLNLHVLYIYLFPFRVNISVSGDSVYSSARAWVENDPYHRLEADKDEVADVKLVNVGFVNCIHCMRYGRCIKFSFKLIFFLHIVFCVQLPPILPDVDSHITLPTSPPVTSVGHILGGLEHASSSTILESHVAYLKEVRKFNQVKSKQKLSRFQKRLEALKIIDSSDG